MKTREKNTMVARVTLHNMRQDRKETVQNFGAHLRGQTGICKFGQNVLGAMLMSTTMRVYYMIYSQKV